MLPSFENSHCVHGNKQKAMARECGVTENTFYKWATGRMRCPKHKRQSVDRAFGAPVDWVQYDLECDYLKRPERDPAARERVESDFPPPTPPAEPSVAPAPAPAASEASDDPFDLLYGRNAA